jgi:hypothetical protein
MYAADSARYPTFAAVQDGHIVGFLTLHEHFAAAWRFTVLLSVVNHVIKA